MTPMRCRAHFACACLVATAALYVVTSAQGVGTTLDEVVVPGSNYDKAEFRLWYPNATGLVQSIVVLVPGSNVDGRSQVDDPEWQAFATKHHFALVGLRLTDKLHELAFIEEYVNVSQGSGQAFLDALTAFARRMQHPEVATAPLLLWGFSAGGEFNYEFVNWKPERVIGFVVNKGGIYYTALASQAARKVPGLLFVGGKDLDSRVQTVTGLFALNRRAGALWALAEEPAAAHVIGRSRDLAIMFFEDILPLRLTERVSREERVALRPLAESSGFLGDRKTQTVRKVGDGDVPSYPMAWLPTVRVAKAWEALLTEKPFEP
jgi:dienelactone hydrolase